MNIYSRSNEGLTPLHWACHANSEIAMIYLLAWYDTSCLSMKDKEGSTPLHLTIKSADELGSGRPMRALLMAGANKDAVDKKKKDAFGSLSLSPSFERTDSSAVLSVSSSVSSFLVSPSSSSTPGLAPRPSRRPPLPPLPCAHSYQAVAVRPCCPAPPWPGTLSFVSAAAALYSRCPLLPPCPPARVFGGPHPPPLLLLPI